MAQHTIVDILQTLILSVQAWFDSVGLGGNVCYEGNARQIFADAVRSLDWKTILNPPLPPGLALIPPISRLLSLAVALPLLTIGLLDFAGYAVFRTLGLRKRRVRVKVGRSLSRSSSQRLRLGVNNTAFASSPAPLLSPGTYDAETLLRHRARTASDARLEADELWARTGGSFARVQAAASNTPGIEGTEKEHAAASGASSGVDSGMISQLDTSLLPKGLSNGMGSDGEEEYEEEIDDSRDSFGMVSGIGVEGPLGFSDTDAESDAGESPTHSRRSSRDASSRRGQGAFGGLKFTPMSEDLPHLGGGKGEQGSGPSWLGLGNGNDGDLYTARAAQAADLAP
ncbi:hypothetical protein K437DRAFT_173061 [Tilletiaria anomala UBC 951]|uniref:Uncharacterized protein n=1 Tax=Tilletiaria anomala (strain ATCC 24038 / CBS 436.72 / UBC 951) TaxID=1037660 RepID=A0A066VIG0_TILAU|nr:uncharacterized protein K437DRAFT_173061 [Tilletiaria anomala UBC 951]KDN41532.1 hypothetical protein K437DRAFT_173061 [Tilletiaria anomala UBC 951]